MDSVPIINKISPGIWLSKSKFWETTSTIIQNSNGCVLIDPGVFPSELNDISNFIKDKPVGAGLITHAHWDHILWMPEFGYVPRYCSAETLVIMQKDRNHSIEEMEAFAKDNKMAPDEWKNILNFNARTFSPGLAEESDLDIEVIPTPGHQGGHCSFWLGDSKVLICGDLLSNIEVPTIESSLQSIGQYLSSLDKLEPYVQKARYVVPGHGKICPAEEALRRLEKDKRYLHALQNWAKEEKVEQKLESQAFQLAEKLGEERIKSPEAWQMHLQNLIILCGGTPKPHKS